MLKPGEVSIRKANHPRYRWVASFRESDSRKRKYFATMREAEDFAADWKVRASEQGTRVVLTDSEVNAVKDFRADLEMAGLNLRTALRMALDHHAKMNRNGDVRTLISKRLSKLENEGRSEFHQNSTKSRLKAFERDFENRSVASISTEEITDWLANLGLTPRTVINYRAALHSLFEEGIHLRYCDANPVTGSLRPRTHETEIGILTVDQAATLLEVADSEILPAILFGMFAGLRTAEIKRLNWEAVDLRRGYVRVGSRNKTGKRLVKMESNLADWIGPHAQQIGAVWPANGRKLTEAAHQDAEIVPWPHNALRHSYGSYWLAKHADLGRLSEAMGNSPEIIKKHYFEAVYPEVADAFWNLLPNENSNVISIA